MQQRVMRTQGSVESMNQDRGETSGRGGPEDIVFSERANNGRAIPRGDSNKQVRASKHKLKGVGQVTLPNKFALQ